MVCAGMLQLIHALTYKKRRHLGYRYWLDHGFLGLADISVFRDAGAVWDPYSHVACHYSALLDYRGLVWVFPWTMGEIF